jgi:hypothetical protein
MTKFLLAAGLVAGLICVANPRPSFAQESAGALQQATVLEDIQSSVVRGIGAENGTLKIAITSNIMTVSRIDSNMSASTHEGRNSEAKEIASIIAGGIKGKREFDKMLIIRVEYSERSASSSERKVFDEVEFRKGPDGVFDFHQS